VLKLVPQNKSRGGLTTAERYAVRSPAGDRARGALHPATLAPPKGRICTCALDHRKVGKPHINAGLKQPRQERHGASKPVKLSDDERDLMHARCGQCLVHRRAIRALSALDFSDDAPVAAVQGNSRLPGLRFDAKSTPAPLAGGNPVVRDEAP
jgi:hypothetical protein